MIHPDSVLQYIDDHIGYGVFAKKFIPKGTIVYVRDQLEISVADDNSLFQDEHYRNILEKYSYVDSRGDYILSWDFGRFVNHSCSPNTLSTGYGFEIAILDIQEGQQITDDYGMFNMKETMACYCGASNCREKISGKDFAVYCGGWDSVARDAIMHLNQVEQPLLHLLDRDTHNHLLTYLNTGENYHSVSLLESRPILGGRRFRQN